MKFRLAHLRTLLAIVGGVSLMMWSCSFAVRRGLFPWVWEERWRLRSPSGEKEIVVLEGNRGAMSGYRYAIYILQRGKAAPLSSGWPDDARFVSTAPVPKLRWLTDTRVVLEVEDGILIYVYEPRDKGSGVMIDVFAKDPSNAQAPNKALEPTEGAVMPRAGARVTPAPSVAHL